MATHNLKEFIKENYIAVFDLEELIEYIEINKLEELIKAIPNKIRKEFGNVKIRIEYDDDCCLKCIVATILLSPKNVKEEDAIKASKKVTKIVDELIDEYPSELVTKTLIMVKYYEYV